MSRKLKTRFYKTVSVERALKSGREGGFIVKLDQYTLKTPGKKSLIFSSAAHAHLVADEWAAQGTHVKPETMPCTRLYNVAIERTPENREAVIAEGVKYTGTDVVCYREGGGTALSRRQAEQWDPILEWAKGIGFALKPTDSLTVPHVLPETLKAVESYLSKLEDLNLTLTVHFISTLGSVVLGVAVVEKHLTAKTAFQYSRLDALWQISQWGEVDDAKDRADMIEAELIALEKLLS